MSEAQILKSPRGSDVSPSERKRCRAFKKLEATEASYQSFDSLPASALVDIGVVCRVFKLSTATVWRWAKTGQLPPPRRIGRSVRWSVGDLRKALEA
ncbi:MAG: helix-turn-helix domain-containing protein [Burkholderiaceae bacterium]